MQINFIAPLSSAWNRMLNTLFKPFDIRKWFVLGFTAFLAHLLEWHGGSSADDKSGDFNIGDILQLPHDAWQWFQDNPEWTALIITGLALLAAFIIFLTWLSSRGKFMFLDNVVHNRALVKKPWADFASIARSLFMWRVGFGIVGFIIFGGYLTYIYYEIYTMYFSNITYYDDLDIVLTALRMGVFFIILSILFAYIWLFLNDFVVPLMYKNNSSVWIGWSRFMPLLQKHFVYFILYGLFILFLYILFVILLIIFGLITCCIGFFLLIIPYIGSVILLPVSIVFRALSLDFLEQFGSSFVIFPDETNTDAQAGE